MCQPNDWDLIVNMAIAMVERNKEEVDDDDEEGKVSMGGTVDGQLVSLGGSASKSVDWELGRTKKLTKDWWEGFTCWVLNTHLVEQNHHTILTMVTAL